MPTWDDYRFFLAVAETGSLSAAARRLHVTQPTVGRRITELEKRLRARLFDRVSHGYALTATGESILSQVRGLDQSVLNIEQKISGQDESLSGRIVLTTTEGLAACWLAPRLIDFNARHPGVDIELLIGLSPLNLLRREADIALRIGNPQSDQLVGRTVARVHFGLYASESYLETCACPRQLADLRRHKIIESVGELADLKQAEALRAYANGAQSPLRSNNAIAQMALLRAGFGIVPLPCYMAAGQSGIVRVLAKEFDLRLDLWLLTHRDLRRTRRIRALLEFLTGAIQRDSGIFTGA